MRESDKLKADRVKKSWRRTSATSNLRPYPPSFLNLTRYCGAKKLRGQFNGSNVVIHNSDHMVTLYSSGFFGKGSLSRSAPVYEISKQRAQQLKNMSMEVQVDEEELLDATVPTVEDRGTLGKSSKLDISASCDEREDSSFTEDCAVLQGDSTENQCQDHSKLLDPKDVIPSAVRAGGHDYIAGVSSCDFLNNTVVAAVKSESASLPKENTNEKMIDSECLELAVPGVSVPEKPQIPVEETLHLNLEEAYFLAYGLGCLQIMDLFGKDLTLLEAWSLFCQSQDDFIQKYVVYHYFRAKGWVVKPGLKFGGDFLLYKHGPPMTHAAYLVIIEVVNNKGELSEDHNPSMSWIKYMSHNRVAENAGKDVLLCRVLWPKDLEVNEAHSPNVIKQFSVQENLFTRWVSSEEREKLDQDT